MNNIKLLARLFLFCLAATASSGSASEESTYRDADECLLYRHFDDFRKAAISEDLHLVKALFSKEVAPYIDEKDINWMSSFFRDIQSLSHFHVACTALSCTLSFKMTHKDTGTERLSIYFLRESDDYKINSVDYIHNSSTESFDEGKTYRPIDVLNSCR